MSYFNITLRFLLCALALSVLALPASGEKDKAKKPRDKVDRQQQPARENEAPKESPKEAPKPAEKPPELDQADVDAARKTVAAMSPREKGVLNGLRFLMRPEFQDEVLKGRKHRTCSLEPIETAIKGNMNLVYALRLWAVLESGLPITAGLHTEINRALVAPVKPPVNSLAEIAVHMSLLRALLSHVEWAERSTVIERAKELHKMAEAAVDLCSQNSSYVSKDLIHVNWFANQFWRAVEIRAAHALGLFKESRQWGKDLDLLGKTYIDKHGWVGMKNQYAVDSLDLHPNLLAMAAFALAAEAPAGLLSKIEIKNAETQLARGSAVLQRLNGSYPDTAFGGSRLLACAAIAMRIAPTDDQLPAKWLDSLVLTAVGTQGASGQLRGGNTFSQDLGLASAAQSGNGESVAMETALGVLALCGPMGSQRPLADKGLVEIGMGMHALALCEAAEAKVLLGDLRDVINDAIDCGVEFLRRAQNPDGSFTGHYSTYSGETALCLLAMLHGGVSRDDKAIERGMKHLDGKNWALASYSYEAGILLMLLQKYYEKEGTASGMLSAKNSEDYRIAKKKMRDSLPHARNKVIDQLIKNLEASYIGNTKSYGYGPGNAGWQGDNSCTQYALLAWHAASLLGGDVRSEVFRREAARLFDTFSEEKRFKPVPYEPEESKTGAAFTVQPGGWGYTPDKSQAVSMQMSAAGMGSLAICIDELKMRGELAADFEDKLERRITAAAAYIGEMYVSEPKAYNGAIGQLENAGDGSGAYYNLYSVERACSLAKIRMLNEKVDWYTIGAKLLIEAQCEDGSWGRKQEFAGIAPRPQLINTCMAILFLRRAALPVLTDHKQRDKSPITGEPRKKDQPKEEEKKAPEAGK